MKFSVAHPNPGKRSAENFAKISRQISRHLWQRKTEKIFTSALLEGSCSDILNRAHGEGGFGLEGAISCDAPNSPIGLQRKVSIMCKWTRPFWGTDCRRAPKSLSSAQAAPPCGKSSKVLAGLAFCEYPRPGSAGVTRGGQQQFATQILRVHLLGLESFFPRYPPC